MKGRVCFVQPLGGMAPLSREELAREHRAGPAGVGLGDVPAGAVEDGGEPVSIALGPPGPCHQLEAPVACRSPKKGE